MNAIQPQIIDSPQVQTQFRPSRQQIKEIEVAAEEKAKTQIISKVEQLIQQQKDKQQTLE